MRNTLHPKLFEFFSAQESRIRDVLRFLYRIKMCTTITHSDLITIHHEMGHIVYFMEYKDQPFIYRNSANPGFHEAIGDTMALAVNTPSHLQSIGLLPEDHEEKDLDKENVGYQFHVALQKVNFSFISFLCL